MPGTEVSDEPVPLAPKSAVRLKPTHIGAACDCGAKPQDFFTSWTQTHHALFAIGAALAR